MGYGRGHVVVVIVVGLDEAVALTGYLMSDHELAVAAPSFCPVEGVVGIVGGNEILHVHCAAEPLESVIRAAVSLEMVYSRAVTYTVESEAVGLFLLGEGVSAVLNDWSVPELS